MTGAPINTLAALIADKACTVPDRDVIRFENGPTTQDVVRTYSELWANSQRIAQALLDMGMRPGEHFALLMANHAEFVETMVAAGLTGTVFVPIDPRTRGDKLAFALKNARCKGVIAADYALDALFSIRKQLAHPVWILSMASDEAATPSSDDFVPLSPYLSMKVPTFVPPSVDADSPMQILFTSGTTGDPKGIVLTHEHFSRVGAVTGQVFGYRADDRPYSGLSLTHANAQLVTLAPALTMGMRTVFSRRFTKSRLWDITRKYGCTTFTLLGGMTNGIYCEPRRTDDHDNPVRLVVSAGMPSAIWRDFEQRFGVHIAEFYGTAEGGMASVKPPGVGPVGSVGKVIPALKYRIIDEMGEQVAPGGGGELLLQWADGSPLKVKYFENAQASAEKSNNGWFWSGDIVHEDADGWLFFDHRKGNGIRRNGEFIHVPFIEKAVMESGCADDIHVYGINAASGVTGEKDVVAAIVPKKDRPFDPQLVFQYCRLKLESNSVPGFIQIVEEIPKTVSEKPLERILVELFAAQPSSVHRQQASKEKAPH